MERSVITGMESKRLKIIFNQPDHLPIFMGINSTIGPRTRCCFLQKIRKKFLVIY